MLVQVQGKGFLSEILAPAWHQFGQKDAGTCFMPRWSDRRVTKMTFTFGRYSACYKKQRDEKLWHETRPWTFSSLESRQPKLWKFSNEIAFNDTIPRFEWFIIMGATNELQLPLIHTTTNQSLSRRQRSLPPLVGEKRPIPLKPWHWNSGPRNLTVWSSQTRSCTQLNEFSGGWFWIGGGISAKSLSPKPHDTRSAFGMLPIVFQQEKFWSKDG